MAQGEVFSSDNGEGLMPMPQVSPNPDFLYDEIRQNEDELRLPGDNTFPKSLGDDAVLAEEGMQDDGGETEFVEISDLSRVDRIKNWVRKRKTQLIVGTAALSTTATLTLNPLNELKEDVVDAAPWVGAGVATSEVAFCVGAAMMVAAVGDKIGNPLRLKGKMHDIALKANDSKTFKTGFWLNAAGAVGDFVVISAGVMKHMPVESYPILSMTLLDLGATVALRGAILAGIRNAASESPITTEDQDKEEGKQ